MAQLLRDESGVYAGHCAYCRIGMTAVIWQPIADSQSLENGAPCSLTEQFCQWHGEAATFSTESAGSGRWREQLSILASTTFEHSHFTLLANSERDWRWHHANPGVSIFILFARAGYAVGSSACCRSPHRLMPGAAAPSRRRRGRQRSGLRACRCQA